MRTLSESYYQTCAGCHEFNENCYSVCRNEVTSCCWRLQWQRLRAHWILSNAGWRLQLVLILPWNSQSPLALPNSRPSGMLVTNPFSSQADIPKGAISCKAITRVYEHRKCGKSKRQFLFCVDTPDRTYTMYAPSEQSMNIWMTCLTISPTAIELQRDQT